MVHILGIVGSPRRGGNTEIIVKNALKAAETIGAETDIVLLSEKRVEPCIACGACSSGKCVIDDDFMEVFEKMTKAGLPGPLVERLAEGR